jgi:hypothetical protein
MQQPEESASRGAEASVAEQLRMLEERLRQTELRLAQTEQQLAGSAEQHLVGSDIEIDQLAASSPTPRWSRRALILGGAGAAAGLAHAAIPVSPAAAALGDPILQGVGNQAGAAATSLTSTNRNYVFLAVGTSNTASGLYGVNDSGIGVRGRTETGTAVLGNTFGRGKAIRGQASGVGAAGSFDSTFGPAIQLLPSQLGSIPTPGDWGMGDVVNDNNGNVWLCVQGGNPGRWRLVGGPQSAGAYVPLTPTRVFDSRRSTPDNGRIITSAEPRVIGVGFARNLDTGAPIRRLLPDGTRAIAANVTITDTSSARGFVALTPGDAVDYQASSINWTAPGATIANGLMLTTDALLRLKAFVRGGNTHLIIDISGYFAQV